MSIARNSLYYGFTQAANLAHAFLTSMVVAIYLGPELRGVFVAALLVDTLALRMTSLGIGSAMSYFGGAKGASLARVHTLGVAWIGLVMLINCGLLAAFGPFLWRHVFKEIPPVYLLAVFVGLPFSFYVNVLINLMVGMGKIPTLSRYVFYKIFIHNLANVIGLIWLDWGVRELIAVWVIGQVLGAGIGYGLLSRWGVLWERLSLSKIARELHTMIAYGFKVFVGNMANVVMGRFDQLFVLSILGVIGVGIYSLSSKLSHMIFQAAISLSSAAYPAIRRASRADAAVLTVDLFRTSFLINGAAVFLMILLARPLIVLAYTESFADAVLPLQILLPGKLMLACSTMLAQYFSVHQGRPQVVAAVNWLAAVLYIPTIWWILVAHGGRMVGVAWVATGANGLVLVCLLALFMKHTRQFNPLPYLIPQRRDFQRLGRLIREVLAKRGL